MNKTFLLIPALVLCASCGDEASRSVEYEFQFDSELSGWQAGFADYPVGSEELYELSSGFEQLPPPLDQPNGYRVSGNNHSDDLFMYVKKEITGLSPDSRYSLHFEITFATNAPSGCIGVGGAPGESVTIKAGATSDEPFPVNDGTNFYRMNIDKGEQSIGGSDAITIGDFTNTQSCEDNDFTNDFTYELKTLDNTDTPFTLTTNTEGNAWVMFGTDSGFEATTTIYYVRGKVSARKI